MRTRPEKRSISNIDDTNAYGGVTLDDQCENSGENSRNSTTDDPTTVGTVEVETGGTAYEAAKEKDKVDV